MRGLQRRARRREDLAQIAADPLGLLRDGIALEQSGGRINGDLAGGEYEPGRNDGLRVGADRRRRGVGMYGC